ncbi:hypothetical protein ACEN33_10715 [Ruoffia sp. FAM 24228]|uniref:hypothetical protein n=1 Tax=unclassified Ruoffia TaxID=2862149 RepID=UPI0026A491FB
MDFEKLKTNDSVIVARFAIIAEFFVLYFDFTYPRDNVRDIIRDIISWRLSQGHKHIHIQKNIKSRLETALLLVKNRVILFLENMKGGCQMKQAVQVSSNLFKMTSPLIVHNIRVFI